MAIIAATTVMPLLSFLLCYSLLGSGAAWSAAPRADAIAIAAEVSLVAAVMAPSTRTIGSPSREPPSNVSAHAAEVSLAAEAMMNAIPHAAEVALAAEEMAYGYPSSLARLKYRLP